jgi:DNA-binding PadR family transcriptional regulator
MTSMRVVGDTVPTALDSGLGPGSWAVLGVLAEAPAHGFGVARRLEPAATIGQVWTMSKTRVYRALAELAARGLIEPAGTAPSERGPERELYAPTARGRALLEAWLSEPVAHVREIRTELLLKLALLFDREASAESLLRSQRLQIEPLLEDLTDALSAARGFQATVLRYRVETARSALMFVEQCIESLVLV